MKKYKLRCQLLLLIIIHLNTSIFASTLNNYNLSFEATSLIKSDGTYWVWGNNQVSPVQIHGVEDVEKSFNNQFIMRKDKSVFYWDRPQLSGAYQVHNVNKLNNLIDLQSAWNDLLAVDQEGKVHHLSIAEGLDYNQLDKIKPLSFIDNVIKITNYYEYQNHSPQVRWGFLKDDGSVWINTAKFPSEDFKPILYLESIVDIDQNIALKKDGTVWTWSDKIIEPNQDVIAVPVTELSNIQSIKSFGTGKTNIGIDRNSSLWFWGGTITGYSDETTINKQPAPVKLTSIKNVKDAFIIDRFLVVLTHDGKVYNTSIQRKIMPENPIFNLLATDVSEIKADSRHMIIKKNDGTLWGWGFNKNGELGVGDYELMHSSLQRMQRPVAVYLNEESIALNSGVIIRNGQAFIPLRSIFEKMGATINWDDNSKTVTISKNEINNSSIDIVINYISGKVTMNNQPVTLSNLPFIISGTSYLPLRFVSESLGANVEWIPNEDKISILMK